MTTTTTSRSGPRRDDTSKHAQEGGNVVLVFGPSSSSPAATRLVLTPAPRRHLSLILGGDDVLLSFAGLEELVLNLEEATHDEVDEEREGVEVDVALGRGEEDFGSGRHGGAEHLGVEDQGDDVEGAEEARRRPDGVARPPQVVQAFDDEAADLVRRHRADEDKDDQALDEEAQEPEEFKGFMPGPMGGIGGGGGGGGLPKGMTRSPLPT
eukprot:CAMPEP_0197421462 /NCGR_PEP_ID=MMETSP1170-20131217/7701_1 /TAXON_ID=54406 /ORGANISM="Sarcinochrysis sp, Strain CCMP770" /LENGTH=209 /DNA_ID=CAMNT_0042948703 /DNA_START=64 /DNA_END=691 /DNA_ORIENTATION=-